MPASPNVLNYFIGRGTAMWTPSGGVARDLGNIVECEVTPSIETLDHFSTRSGVRNKDRSVVLEKSATLRIVLDEITAENVSLLLLGNVTENTDGTKSFRIFSESEINGALTFTGTNDVGNKISGNFPSVTFNPSGSLNLISDEFGQIELTGELLATEYTDGTSDFGTMTFTDAA